MSTRSRPRAGSLQFWPRKRAAKVIPSANWRPISAKNEGFLGFFAYKAGMVSVAVKDLTDKSMTQNKQIIIPATVLEVPAMKIHSVRFYKNGKVLTEIQVATDKELKKKVKLAKTPKNLDNHPIDYDDIRVIAYSIPKKTNIKKTPDILELAIQSDNKLEFVKKYLNKEITFADFVKSDLIDVRGVTIGKGFQGPIKRFGATLRFHKSEKGVRKIGSIGPWHPARVTFQVPMAGQMGYHTRIVYNLKVLNSGTITEKDINPKSGFSNYGKLKSSYIIIKGSVPGPVKRQLLLTPSFRPSKLQSKKKYEFIEVLS